MIKKLFLRYRSLLLAIPFIIVIIFLMTNYADNRKNNNELLIRNAENAGLFNGGINLNQNYLTIRDSINYIRDWTVYRLRAGGDGVTTPFVGVVKLNECDSCYSFDKKKFRSEYKNKYFIRLNGYTLEDEASFFIQNDKYYIRYPIWDSIYGNGSATGHDTTKEVSVRYSIPNEENTAVGSLLVPISANTYRFMNTLIWILAVACIVLFVYIFLALPVRTLYRIAEGHPFTKRNIRRLYTVGWALLAIPILPPLVSVIIEWFLRNKIPGEIYYPFFQSILDNRAFLIAGLVVLLIAYAFKKGYKLQQEQDLTI